MRTCRLIVAILPILTGAPALFCQSNVRGGDIAGSVTNSRRQAVAGVRLSITDVDRGTIRVTETDPAGNFRAVSIPAGIYQVRFEVPGYRPLVLDRIVVPIGETVPVFVEMQPVEAQQPALFRVNVNARVPIIATERSQQADIVDSRRIENLPINRRNFLDFARLVPGVLESEDLVDDSDLRPAQSPQSGLSIGGNNGRGNSFSVDGASNDYNSGGVRPSLSQSAVQEFQVNRNSFSAEFGAANGGVVNIVSKSGSNDPHGGFFGILRHRAIQARNYFDGEKSPFTRVQSGAFAGGPIVRDRTHWFAVFERLDRHETVFVPILNDQSAFRQLTPSQSELAAFFDSIGSPELRQLSGAMRQLLVTENFPNTLRLFRENSGNFPFAEANKQFSIRLDHAFSPKHLAFFRANTTKSESDLAQAGALFARNRGHSRDSFDSTLMANSTYVASSAWAVETRLAFAYNNYELIPSDPFGPEININGFGLFGRNIFLPSKNLERMWQAQQTFSHYRGRHLIKFGYNIVPVKDSVRQDVLMAGQFGFGEAVPLGFLLNQVTGNPTLDATLKALLISAGQGRLAPRIDDPISALQAFNLGLPVYFQQGFGEPNWSGWSKRIYVFVADSLHVTPALKLDIGLRHEFESASPSFPRSLHRFGPRFGFAWSPSSRKRTVIRGGYGLFPGAVPIPFRYVADHFGNNRITTTAIPIAGLPGPINPMTGQPLSAVDIYQTLLRQGVLGNRPIRPDDLHQFNLRPGPNMPLRVLFGIDPDFRGTYAHQSSFEIEHAIGGAAISAAYNFNRGLRAPRPLDRNVTLAGQRPDGTPIFGFKDPSILQNNIFESTANSYYHALVLRADRRLSGRFLFNAHYTWSKTIDDVTDFAPDFQPDNQLDARPERSLSAFHRGHRFVASSVIELPALAGARPVWKNAAGGFVASVTAEAASFRPFNVVTGFDSAGDNHPAQHRPRGLARNVGRGPNLFTIDARLSRKFRLYEQLSAEFVAEMFNALNRTNFRTVNNSVGAILAEQLSRPITGIRAFPTRPLAFTSAYDPRQLQLGLWLRF